MRDTDDARELLEFSFESVATPVPPAALWRLARRAAVFNRMMGVTGRLCLDGGRFVQTIEGRAAIVLPLAGLILADERHEAIRVTAFGAIAARRFDDWQDAGLGADDGTPVTGNLVFLAPRLEMRRTSAPATVVGAGTACRLLPLSDA